MKRYPPIIHDYPHFLHGGDYNPDQWLQQPEIIDEDFRLAKLAHINSFSVGIFSWVSYEPEEGAFRFDWLDRIMDRMAENGMKAVLATPSGARPAWMSFKYPEVLRVQPDGHRIPHCSRHNHCPTSPIYREKVGIINSKLAERYHDHPALGVWHLSNEYGGECHCPLCYAAFREWLQRKYGSLDALNQAWWTAFWSHTYTDWEQIEPRDSSVLGMMLDWKRFTTDQAVDFMRHEIAALRQYSKETPCTTNMMGFYVGLNYWKFAPELDVISWDNYPFYHDRDDMEAQASWTAMTHDMNRAMKRGQPFMMMESTPSTANWQPINKLKRPGVHLLSSLQAVAHGADTVQYFQYRKGRGAAEKFHGAVVDHVGHEHTRVFEDVTEVGEALEKLTPVLGAATPAKAAIIIDWENRWALEASQGPRRDKQYMESVGEHYRALWRRGIPTDVIDEDAPLDGYKLVIAPMLYLLRPGVAERIARFTENGGTFVATYLTGIVDENDRCFLGGWPGPLRPVLGIWAEEIDPLYDNEGNTLIPMPDNGLGLAGSYGSRTYCDLIHPEGARVLAAYGTQFYAGRACLTVNQYGKGRAYYLATRAEERFLGDFYGALLKEAGIRPALEAALPQGVTVQLRGDGEREYVFLLNFARDPRTVSLGADTYADLLDGGDVRGSVTLPGYGVRVLSRPARS